MTFQKLLVITGLLGIPSISPAEITFDGAATLGYHTATVSFNQIGSDVEIGDINTTETTVTFDSTVAFNDALETDLSFAFIRSENDNTSKETETWEFSIAPRYRFSNGIFVSAFYDQVDVSILPFSTTFARTELDMTS